MAARLTWKPYMFNPRLPHFLPRVTNPTLIVWGREDQIVPVDLRRAVPRGCCPTRRCACSTRCGHLPPDRAAGRVRGPRARLPDRGSRRRHDDEALLVQRDAAPRVSGRRGRQVPVHAPGVPEHLLHRRRSRQRNYQRYLDEYELADEVGFDGLMINEHHTTPSCVNVSANMTAAILARTTRRAKIAAARQHPAHPGQPGA